MERRMASVIRNLLRPAWVRWILLPVLVLFAAHAGWTLISKWRFEARLQEMRAAGEPVELRDLAPPPVPEDENAAALLLEAERVYEEQLADQPVGVVTDPENWLEEDRAELQEWLAKGEHYRTLLARAAAKPALRMDLDWEAGPMMRVATIPAMHHAAEFLEYRARFGKATAESIRDLDVMLGLAPKLERQTAISVLVRWTIEGVAADTLVLLSARPDFDVAAARAALDPAFASAIAAQRPLVRDALLGERTIGISVARRWISGESPTVFLREIDSLTGGEEATDAEDEETSAADVLAGSWLFRPIAYGDALRLIELMDQHLVLVDLPPRDALARTETLQEEYAGKLPWLISSLYAVLPTKLHVERQRHLAHMRLARVGLALLELRKRNGEWPRSLRPVAALIGADAMIDPYTGDELQYEPGVRLEAAAPIVEGLREEMEIVWRFR
jgi:hypothetical protein